ncbi:hypothetical protein ACFV2N_46640 [Streptomyces sp. NPDC059680]|uniref:hypothetical protein n=1 Tax=Streptomyces sp. NPDC059680 TaxID=3346904 RepID=UPI0036878D02
MNATTATRRRLVYSGIVVVCATLAGAIGVRLSQYDVPASLLVACSGSCLATFTSLAFRCTEALSTITHQCAQPGCDFRVRLTNADAAENRRWQEIAAQHPHRAL